MDETFFFYDLETTGFHRFNDKIMQFAGQRYSLDLDPIGEPVNVLIQTPQDCLPSIDAILLTGITPQQTLVDGLTEAAFLEYFHAEIATPGTIFIGFNSVRFDDEFMRALMYRNFYDPYEWQYKDGKSRADILDIVRITRALRPDGIKWPVSEKGAPSNRLVELTTANDLEHAHAHDAMSDVYATVAVARLINEHAPKLFRYMISMRSKKAVQEFIDAQQLFVYVSGRYAPEYTNATVVMKISDYTQGRCYVYDLRHDPALFIDKTKEEIAAYIESGERYPVKALKLGACPAIAPIATLDDAAKSRLFIDLDEMKRRAQFIQDNPSLQRQLVEAIASRKYVSEAQPKSAIATAEASLYDKFISDVDRSYFASYRESEKAGGSPVVFGDARMQTLQLPYRARNYPRRLTTEQHGQWNQHIIESIFAGQPSKAEQYVQEIAEKKIALQDQQSQYVLSELELWVQSIYPEEMPSE